MKIYTKAGDKGHTKLMGGKDILKSDPLLEIYGGLDELNSILGVSLSLMPDKVQANTNIEIIKKVQFWLFKLGAHLATPKALREKYSIETVFSNYTEILEVTIDSMSAQLAPLKNFIIPGGSSAASQLHVGRSFCRRIERRLVAYLDDNTNEISNDILPFINRLSDFLFVSARYVNMLSGVQDVTVEL